MFWTIQQRPLFLPFFFALLHFLNIIKTNHVFMICTQISNDSPESRSSKKKETIWWDVPQESEVIPNWRDAVWQFGINVGRRFQSHVTGIFFFKKRFWLVPFFNAFSMPNVRGTFQSSVCFLYTSFVRRVTRGSARWEWLWNWVQSWSKSGRPCFNVGTCICVNYLLVVQQEMRNDNKLGKEKQNNKQMESHTHSFPFLSFLFSPLLVFNFFYVLSWDANEKP